MSKKILRRVRRMAFTFLTAASTAVATTAVATTAHAQALGNDCGPPNAPVHPIDQAIDNLTHVFDNPLVDDRPCAVPKYKIWATADYMVTWLNGTATPPLITTNGVPFGNTGNVVFGGGAISEDATSGARFSVGGWLTDRYDRGVEAGGFVLGNRQTSFTASGSGAPNSISVGRPIILFPTGTESVAFSALPGFLSGSSSALLTTNLWGAEANALARERLIGSTFITFLGGVRYIDLDQQLDVQDRTVPLVGRIPLSQLVQVVAPDSARITDTFATHNQFFGGQIGFRTTTELGRFDLGVGAKFALGGTRQVVNIKGLSEFVDVNGQTVLTAPGGLLATSSNMGRYTREAFSIVPEVELKLGFRVTDYLTAYISWDYLYWSRVVQPGNQIDRTVDFRRVPTSDLFQYPPLLGNAHAADIKASSLTMNSLMFGACLKY